MSRCGLGIWQLYGDPVTLARDNILTFTFISVFQTSSHERQNPSEGVEYSLEDLHYLEVVYNTTPYPTTEQMSNIAEDLRVPISKVRVSCQFLAFPSVNWWRTLRFRNFYQAIYAAVHVPELCGNLYWEGFPGQNCWIFYHAVGQVHKKRPQTVFAMKWWKWVYNVSEIPKMCQN